MGMGLLGALGGLGEGIAMAGQQMYRSADARELEQEKMNWLLEKQKQLEEFHDKKEQEKGNRMIAEIDNAKAAKYANGDGANLNQAQKIYQDLAESDPEGSKAGLLAVEEAKGRLSKDQKLDPSEVALAGVKAGVITGKDLAGVLAKEKSGQDKYYEHRMELERKLELEREKEAGRNSRSDNREDGRNARAAIQTILRGGGKAGSGSSGSTRTKGGAGSDAYKSASDLYKDYDHNFKADKESGQPADDLGAAAFKEIVAQYVASGRQVTPRAAVEIVDAIKNIREQATNKGVVDTKLYKSLLNKNIYSKYTNLIGDAENNMDGIDNPDLATMMDQVEQANGSPATSSSGNSPAISEDGNRIVAKGTPAPTAQEVYSDFYKPAGNVLNELGRSAKQGVGVPLAELLDILRGKKNYEALGKDFDSYADKLRE